STNPRPESRMNVPQRVRQHVLHKVLVRVFDPFRRQGERLIELLVQLLWQRLPYWTLADTLQIIQHVIEHAMPQLTQFGPILRIKSFVRPVHAFALSNLLSRNTSATSML